MAGRQLAGAGGRLATSVRVDRTEKEAFCAGGFHHHVTALETEGGTRLRTGPVIADIRLGAATYHVVIDGVPVELVVRDACRGCSEPYLATAADDIRHEHLLELPDIGRPAAHVAGRAWRGRAQTLMEVGSDARSRLLGTWLGSSARSRAAKRDRR